MSRGKNALKDLYLQRAILYLESEIEYMKLIIGREERSISNKSTPQKTKVYFMPKPKEGLGIDSMGEIVVSLELSQQFVNEEGKPAAFIHLAQALETAFNFSFGDAYRSKGRVFKRKSYNLTKALDYLKNLIIRVNRKNKMKKDAFINH